MKIHNWCERTIAADSFQIHSTKDLTSSFVYDLFASFDGTLAFLSEIEFSNEPMSIYTERFLSISSSSIRQYCVSLLQQLSDYVKMKNPSTVLNNFSQFCITFSVYFPSTLHNFLIPMLWISPKKPSQNIIEISERLFNLVQEERLRVVERLVVTLRKIMLEIILSRLKLTIAALLEPFTPLINENAL
jgi:hypothetical protein